MKLPLLLLAALTIAIGAAFHAPAHDARAALVLETDMYGGYQVPPVNTQVWGFVRFFWSDDRRSADYTVDVKGVSFGDVTGAAIHRGAPGSNGPVVHTLADTGFLTYGGHITFTQAELQEMLAGGWYVTLSTTDHPEGAIRGQILLPSNFFSPDAPSTAQMPGLAPPPGSSLPAVVPTLVAPPSGSASVPVFIPTESAPTQPPAVGPCLADCGVPVAQAPVIPNAPSAPRAPAPNAGSFVITPPNTGDGGLRD